MKLSIFVVTYNQENYIRQCLDGILAQQVNFDYEIVIGEDCSTDNTRKICEEYAKSYSCIKLLPLQKNIGLVKNWERVLNYCTGEYIAMCEGDDYWIDTEKLQKQVDFLENNLDYSLSFHKVKLFYDENIKQKETIFCHLQEREYSAKEIYDVWSVLTSSVVFRNKGLLPLTFPKQIIITDIYLTLLILEKGKAYCHNFVGVAYRRHLNSISMFPTLQLKQKLFSQYRYMEKRFPALKEISIRKKNDYLNQLLCAPFFKGIWKYRLYKMLDEPKLFFTSYLTTTLTSYIFEKKR